jgi:hypothetical protein
LVQIAHKVRKAKEKFGFRLGPVDPAISVPLLDAATLEDNGDLQDRWVALLVNVSSRPEDDVRGFPEILKQLTPAMARFLDQAVDETLEDYQSKINELTAKGTQPDDYPIPVQLRPETVATLTDVQVGHLERLGLVRANRSPGFGDPEIYMFRITDPLYVSPLGKAFVKACRLTPPKENNRQ